MSSRRFRRKTSLPEDIALQITSMADIFTILLVFLLKTFSTGVTNLSPSSSVTLPEAHSEDQVTESLKVEISPTAILIEDKPVMVLDKFQFNPHDLDSQGQPKPVISALQLEREREMRKPSSSTPPTDTPASDSSALDPTKVASEKAAALTRLTVVADENTPYDVVRTVMATATTVGFSDFKLVVVEDR